MIQGHFNSLDWPCLGKIFQHANIAKFHSRTRDGYFQKQNSRREKITFFVRVSIFPLIVPRTNVSFTISKTGILHSRFQKCFVISHIHHATKRTDIAARTLAVNDNQNLHLLGAAKGSPAFPAFRPLAPSIFPSLLFPPKLRAAEACWSDNLMEGPWLRKIVEEEVTVFHFINTFIESTPLLALFSPNVRTRM